MEQIEEVAQLSDAFGRRDVPAAVSMSGRIKGGA
jgi:hypothetical protein